jgi:hypothetical protein
MENLTNDNLIEKLICEPMKDLKRIPMSEKQSKYFIQLTLISQQNKNIGKHQDFEKDMMVVLKKAFMYNLITKRIKICFDYQIKDIYLYLFLLDLCSSPGIAIMYLTYFQYWCFKNNVWKLDFDTFVQRIFPLGFWEDNDLHKVWENTKIHSIEKNFNFKFESKCTDNLIDHSIALKSIRKQN